LTRAAVDSAEAVFSSAMVCSCLMECRFNDMKAGKVPQSGIFCLPRKPREGVCGPCKLFVRQAFISAQLCFMERRMSALPGQ
jgi:hypothetical protein